MATLRSQLSAAGTACFVFQPSIELAVMVTKFRWSAPPFSGTSTVRGSCHSQVCTKYIPHRGLAPSSPFTKAREKGKEKKHSFILSPTIGHIPPSPSVARFLASFGDGLLCLVSALAVCLRFVTGSGRCVLPKAPVTAPNLLV